jgi:hypothetical protein
MAKIHMIISADPLPNGSDMTAICGETITKANAVPLTQMEEPRSTILFCRECFGRNYFYAITSGQTAHDLEESVA